MKTTKAQRNFYAKMGTHGEIDLAKDIETLEAQLHVAVGALKQYQLTKVITTGHRWSTVVNSQDFTKTADDALAEIESIEKEGVK